MGSQVSTSHINVNANNNNNVKVSRSKRMDKFAEDVRRITSAASKLRLHKRKDKVVQTAVSEKPAKESFKESPPAGEKAVEKEQQLTSKKAVEKEQRLTSKKAVEKEQQLTSSAPAIVVATAPQVKSKIQQQPLPPLPDKPSVGASTSAATTATGGRGLPHHVVAATRVQQQPRKWTLSDLLQTLGSFVQQHCTHLHTVPSASEVAMWARCADRALQLNGWTVNSFLLESHVVFTYILISKAFQHFHVRTLTDVKELVLMCLYISYTYNANEISYPLRPFLVKQDRASFWDKCTRLSLGASSEMLRLNQDMSYYSETLTSLKKSGLHRQNSH